MGEPSYLALFRSGELEKRAELALSMLDGCRVCPRVCGVNRIGGEKGYCGVGRNPVISSYGPHFGEEAPLVGRRGSGTIFFSGCNLGCRFCQNWDISQRIEGAEMGAEELADVMVEVQGMGCHNLNLVSPSHVVPQILEALVIACSKGLRIPIVYNTGGYDSLEVLGLLDGIVDIYMPDMKYSDPEVGERLSMVKDYPMVNFDAVREMNGQVGPLLLDKDGVAVRGLLVRHLVLPNGLAGTRRIVKFLAEEISLDTYLNIMFQYRPEFQAMDCEGMDRKPTRDEYREALRFAAGAGLHRFDGLKRS
ncbi:MAG: radical SAM protein [Thermoplasmatota archaeon]